MSVKWHRLDSSRVLYAHCTTDLVRISVEVDRDGAWSRWQATSKNTIASGKFDFESVLENPEAELTRMCGVALESTAIVLEDEARRLRESAT